MVTSRTSFTASVMTYFSAKKCTASILQECFRNGWSTIVERTTKHMWSIHTVNAFSSPLCLHAFVHPSSLLLRFGAFALVSFRDFACHPLDAVAALLQLCAFTHLPFVTTRLRKSAQWRIHLSALPVLYAFALDFFRKFLSHHSCDTALLHQIFFALSIFGASVFRVRGLSQKICSTVLSCFKRFCTNPSP